jgi:D-sedoheptulose 7-phosphate isomerase
VVSQLPNLPDAQPGVTERQPSPTLPPLVAVPIVDKPVGPVEALVRDITREYLDDFSAVMEQISEMDLVAFVNRLRVARDSEASIFIIGNGGSAATATHWANDLGKATRSSGRRYIRVASLSDNVSWLTALANDEGYERVFSGQLENLARSGDVLIVISASGSSPNLLAALETARSKGMVALGLLGFDGGRLSGRLDEELLVRTPIGAYGLVETAHSLLADVVTNCLIADRLRS